MNKRLLAVSISVALLSLSQTSQATPITLSGSIADSTYLNSGTYSGVFDGTSALPGNYLINSASFAFHFSDNQDAVQSSIPITTGTTTGNYSLGSSGYDGSNFYYSYFRNVTTYQTQQKTGQQEGAAVSIGGISAGSGATAMSTSSSVSPMAYNGQTFDSSSGYNGYYYSYNCGGNYSCGGWQPGTWYYYYSDNFSQLTTNTQDWSGDFYVTGSITDQTVLDQLLNTNALNFSVNITGDLFLSSARLLLDVTETTSLPANGVPEPSTALLALTALGSLVRLRTRRTLPDRLRTLAN